MYKDEGRIYLTESTIKNCHPTPILDIIVAKKKRKKKIRIHVKTKLMYLCNVETGKLCSQVDTKHWKVLVTKYVFSILIAQKSLYYDLENKSRYDS